MKAEVVVSAPGRVVLMGDHTDTSGGLVCAMAIDLGTTVSGVRGGDRIRITSDLEEGEADLPLKVDDPAATLPAWARYVAGIVSAVRPNQGLVGHISSNLPLGAGLASSAALQVSLALALGFNGDRDRLARLVMDAEHESAGVPCGIMDPLVCAGGEENAALRVDCTTGELRPVPLPQNSAIVLVDSGRPRKLASSHYGRRRAEVDAAQAALGSLRALTADQLSGLDDPVLRRRARHVTTENARVDALVDALSADDLVRAGSLMLESHRSLAEDMEVSTPELDALVARLMALPGVHGARLTGAGFGGYVVALTDRGTLVPGGHVVRAVAGPLVAG